MKKTNGKIFVSRCLSQEIIQPVPCLVYICISRMLFEKMLTKIIIGHIGYFLNFFPC